MKTSVIKDILYAIRENTEIMNMPKYDDKNAEIICNTYDELKEKLSPELLKLHQKLVDAIEYSWAEEVDFYFAEGFKLGLLVGFECTDK